MASVNKAILVGNLGADPETRYTAGGDAICNISVATTESWKDKNGERKDATERKRVMFYRKLAEVAGQYLRKGSQVYIEGKIKTRKWQDKDGKDRYTTEIVASDLTMLGSKSDAHGQGGGGQDSRQAQAASSRPASHRQPSASHPDLDDDIPF